MDKEAIEAKLDRLKTYLLWNLEHFTEFQEQKSKLTHAGHVAADRELEYLEDTLNKSYQHFLDLEQLLECTNSSDQE